MIILQFHSPAFLLRLDWLPYGLSQPVELLPEPFAYGLTVDNKD